MIKPTEWLFEKLKKSDRRMWDDLLKQANKMFEQQIIDAIVKGFCISAEGFNGEYGINDFNNIKEEISAEQYYNETYGSKGSDETLKENHIVDTNEMVSSQTEISDEEIEKGADKFYPYDELLDDGLIGMIISAKKGAWFDAIKWYREQIKNK